MPAAQGVQGKRKLRRDHLDRICPGIQMTKADISCFLSGREAKGSIPDALEHCRKRPLAAGWSA